MCVFIFHVLTDIILGGGILNPNFSSNYVFGIFQRISALNRLDGKTVVGQSVVTTLVKVQHAIIVLKTIRYRLLSLLCSSI